ncbi:MAG: DUF1217 domain-containing protein [Pseudomonadota bacterium]
MLPTLTSYNVLQRNAPSAVVPAGTVSVEAEVEYWRQTIGSINNALELVADQRLLDFITKAYGYGDNPPLSSLVLIALEQGAADASDFANSTPDGRLEEMARQFGFAEFGTARIRDARFTEGLVNRYRTALASGDASPTTTSTPTTQASVAIDYFKTQIGNVAKAEDVVSDSALFQFALKSFGLEEEYGNSPFLIQQALAEGVGDATDLANKIGDPRLISMARVFGFGEVDTANVQDTAFGDSMARRYLSAIGAAQTQAKDGESDESLYFRENIGRVQTVDDLLADTKLFTYVMTAFDLAGEVDKTAFVRKVLEEGGSDREAFANRLPDPRYRDLARNIAFKEYGPRNLQDPVILDDIVARYERVALETQAGQENPVVELAAYFDRRADSLSSWLFVTADSRLQQVAATALGVPTAALALNTDRLVEEFEARYDITDLQDEDKRARFIERYIAQADAASGAATIESNAYVLGLFSGGSGSALYSLVSQL